MGGRSVDLRPRHGLPNVPAAPMRSRPSRRRIVAPRAAAKSDKNRVVITGQGIASVFGNDVDTFYNSLLEGKSGVGQITRFDASDFPTTFAAQIKDLDIEGLVDKKNARRYDDCILYSLISAKKALKDAGIEKGSEAFEKLDKTRSGVLIGSGMGGLTVFQDGVKNLVEKGYKKITPFFIPYAITNMGGALVAIETGFMGPNYSISTACATANYAFVAAANHIRKGEADIMLVGGSEAPIIPVGLGGFVACRALSSRSNEPEKASRPWDKGRDGFVMGEGAGVLVMESYEHAMERGANILAEYLGGAITCDAYHMTDPRADGLGVSTCIELAMKDAGIEKEQINYINAHATSTLVGDVAEVKAIKKVFTDMSHVKVNGTKSLIGHCLGAAGGLEAVATIQAIRTGWLHPTLNQDDLVDEVADIDTVPNEKKQHEVTAAISNSFGFGGHNSVVVFGPYKG
ncbi:g9054 [Coccomyxa viridis]|uniref:3-oxoacyl-[acyl-carrier-protein] synthase n=1 Tax=Coccomyxa viridis TaxID=1274662 RepID=A0ABP1G200_9CHLO